MLPDNFTPFVERSPITIMAGMALARMLSATRLDALFKDVCQEQYVGTLMFSTVFELMAGVVVGTRKSIHHAYQFAEERVGVSVVSVYDKLKKIETHTSQALVRDLAAEVAPLIDQMGGGLPPLVDGYAARILDGNCIAASEHRIKELRSRAAGALPGKSLVVLDPQRHLIRDVFPCEDGHTQERALLDQVVPTITANELWIADRNFCVLSFLRAIDRKEARFVIRQHANLPFQILSPFKKLGDIESGAVFEQPVIIGGEGQSELRLRLITIRLKSSTRDGDKTIQIYSNLPAEGPGAVDGMKIAEVYRSRWKIETAFQELAQHINSEINTLGYPKAALFGFCVALVIFNAFSLMQAALRGCHGADKIQKEVSNYYIAAEIETTSRGMMIAIPLEYWRMFATMSPAEFARTMLMLAGKMKLEQFRKHPRVERGKQNACTGARETPAPETTK